MPFDRTFFFNQVRPMFGGRLTQSQVDGMSAILDEWEHRLPEGDVRWLAYMLATTFHETARQMTPVREAYWLSESWRRRNLRYYPYYGRGYVQLTWLENYRRAGNDVGDNLVENPELALRLDYAAAIMFVGMQQGWFRADSRGPHNLPRYFRHNVDDPVGARAIINGYEAGIAEAIARYHAKFLGALQLVVPVRTGYGASVAAEHAHLTDARSAAVASAHFEDAREITEISRPPFPAAALAEGAAQSDPILRMTADIVTGFVSHNKIDPSKIAELVADVFLALSSSDDLSRRRQLELPQGAEIEGSHEPERRAA
ncbi:hypothetical protein GOL26_09595 [Sinorhizobium medicae]|uniref:glycoside hydrolase family 19 protein n=1 Tax=Rhizobium meliloti TaxID=382 RepID=UPI000FD38256|nr:glycoside hydrolase family 19 protein [Sinorhizobium meliloti]MDX0995185.1 hypothetical protein [Sinorhizobium medicae]MDX1179045.1 hypothetical protein [Sinorhizobium medicae]RVH09638.1 hypothetical protein CN216_27850 [Sinorhizobium meliloti]RVI15022.1 hypothetical protein CN206_03660 [Sinorhizobium meliloti]